MENEVSYMFKFLFGSLILMFIVNTALLWLLSIIFDGEFVKIICGGILVFLAFSFIVVYLLTPTSITTEEYDDEGEE